MTHALWRTCDQWRRHRPKNFDTSRSLCFAGAALNLIVEIAFPSSDLSIRFGGFDLSLAHPLPGTRRVNARDLQVSIATPYKTTVSCQARAYSKHRLHVNPAHSMEASPLTQQPQPEVFTPKIISLYDALFKVRLPRGPLAAASIPSHHLSTCLTASRYDHPSLAATSRHLAYRNVRTMTRRRSRRASGRSSSSCDRTALR